MPLCKGAATMRVCICPGCGKQFEAADEAALFVVGRAHADEAHPDENVPDELIWQIIAESATDA
jgi:hypothetical protein